MTLSSVSPSFPESCGGFPKFPSNTLSHSEGLAVAQKNISSSARNSEQNSRIENEVVPVASQEAASSSLSQLICRIVWIASAIGLVAGVVLTSPWAVTVGVSGFAAGVIGDYSLQANDQRRVPSRRQSSDDLRQVRVEDEWPLTDSSGFTEISTLFVEPSSLFTEEPIELPEPHPVRQPARVKPSSHVQPVVVPSYPVHPVPLEIQEKITGWAKLGKKITAPTIRNRESLNLKNWLQTKTEQDYRDLFHAMPEKMAELIENFPEVFAEVCSAKEIAFLAVSLHGKLSDPQGKAMTNILQNVFQKFVIPANLAAGGKLCNQWAITQFYNLLSAFADTEGFNPALENQLNAIKLKIPASEIPGGGRTPAQLMTKIHTNIEESRKAAAAAAALLAEEPFVSEERKEEIRNFAEIIIQNPDADHFIRRQVLTVMAKHPARAEIPCLIEYLGTEYLGKLWAFEAVVDNRANDPTLRLTQMFQALSSAQFRLSVSSPDFITTIFRCPPSLLGLSLNRLQELSDRAQCDEALSELYKILLEDKSTPIFQKGEKMAILAEAVSRLGARAALEEARLRALEPAVNVQEFADSLMGTENPVEMGNTIDKLDDEQLHEFIRLLGNGDQLQKFWTVMGRKILARSLTQEHKARLMRIYPRMSQNQVVAAAANAGFRVILDNAEDGYIEASVKSLSAEQLGIIASNYNAVWHLIDLINKLEKRDPEKFHKLLAIATHIPKFSEVLTTKYQSTLQIITIAVEKHFVTMLPPLEGWGIYQTKQKAMRRIAELLKSKLG